MAKLDKNDTELFRDYVKDVKPLKKHDKVIFDHKPVTIKTPTNIKQKQTATTETVEPEITLFDDFIDIDAEEELFFAKPGLQTKLLRNFRRGQIPIEKVIDLHGFTIAEAKLELVRFLQSSLEQKKRNVLIIHGKGIHSKAKTTTIKSAINCWLRQLNEVLAFCSAQPKDGGRGAIYVLLRKQK